MAAFDREADITHATDFQIARAEGVVPYRQPHVLDDAARSLLELGCDVVHLDASGPGNLSQTSNVQHQPKEQELGAPVRVRVMADGSGSVDP